MWHKMAGIAESNVLRAAEIMTPFAAGIKSVKKGKAET